MLDAAAQGVLEAVRAGGLGLARAGHGSGGGGGGQRGEGSGRFGPVSMVSADGHALRHDHFTRFTDDIVAGDLAGHVGFLPVGGSVFDVLVTFLHAVFRVVVGIGERSTCGGGGQGRQFPGLLGGVGLRGADGVALADDDHAVLQFDVAPGGLADHVLLLAGAGLPQQVLKTAAHAAGEGLGGLRDVAGGLLGAARNGGPGHGGGQGREFPVPLGHLSVQGGDRFALVNDHGAVLGDNLGIAGLADHVLLLAFAHGLGGVAHRLANAAGGSLVGVLHRLPGIVNRAGHRVARALHRPGHGVPGGLEGPANAAGVFLHGVRHADGHNRGVLADLHVAGRGNEGPATAQVGEQAPGRLVPHHVPGLLVEVHVGDAAQVLPVGGQEGHAQQALLAFQGVTQRLVVAAAGHVVGTGDHDRMLPDAANAGKRHGLRGAEPAALVDQKGQDAVALVVEHHVTHAVHLLARADGDNVPAENFFTFNHASLPFGLKSRHRLRSAEQFMKAVRGVYTGVLD